MMRKATPILFNLDNLQLPAGFAWESKVSSNGQRRGTFTGGFRSSSSGIGGKIDWKSYDAAREEEPEIVEFLVEEYFVADKQERPDGTYSWRCGNICGDPARDGKQGSFEIDEIGRCTEWATEEHFSIMQAITSEEREERFTYQDAFIFLAEQGYNFFMSTIVTFPDLDKRPQTICYDEDFTCEGRDYPAGVYIHDILPGKKDEPDTPLDYKISSPIKAAAITRTREIEEFSLLLDFVPKGETEWRKILLTRASLIAERSDVARTQLANAGVVFLSGHWKYLQQYLERLEPPTYLTQVKVTGWVDRSFKTFVLPHRMIGDTTEVYFDPGLERIKYNTSGTLDEWKTKVASLAVGNKWLLFALSVALTGPLLQPLNLAGFGGHLHGDSSMGKTTILLVAVSVWGEPRYLKTWRTTSNGLEITCAGRSGTLLVLDESHQATAEVVGDSAYMIANGMGKNRMTKAITERPVFNWRVVTLSSGETTLEVQIESGRGKYKVGQEVRMTPLNPTKGKHGVFDDLHDYATGAEFAQHLSAECAHLYGNAGIEFMEQLIARGIDGLAARSKDEMTKLTEGYNVSPQELRVAKNLAAVVLAGELAIEFGIFPFEEGTVRAAVREVFIDWLPARVDGNMPENLEHNQIITAVRDFIDTYESRFAPFHLPQSVGIEKLKRPPLIHELAGYWEDDKDGKRVYLFYPAALKTVTPGKDTKRVIKALYDQKAFSETGSKGETAKLRKPRGKVSKFYHIIYEAL